MSSSPYRTEAEAYAPQVPDYAARRRAAVGLRWYLVGLVCRAVMGAAFAGLIGVSTATGHVDYSEIAAWVLATIDAGLAGALLYGLWTYARLPDDMVIKSVMPAGFILILAGVGLGFLTAGWVDDQAMFAAKKITHTMTALDRAMADKIEFRIQAVGAATNLAGLAWQILFAISLRKTAAWLEEPKWSLLAQRVLTWTIAIPAAAIVWAIAVALAAGTGLGLAIAALGAIALLGSAVAVFVFWIQLLAGLSRGLADAGIEPDPDMPEDEPAEAWGF